MLRIKVDENLPDEVADLFRQAGHDAMTVADQRLAGKPDQRVSEIARSEGRALVSLDLDFADVRVYPPGRYPGLIVLRLAVQSKPRVLEVIARALPALASQPVAGRLWIIDERSIRI
ncbi:MAG TPA: DUF5615 family PIN-like protein, partial [Tepidisphaeraceae bacterium]|nr:DUF5615 family PIN-like protein [Tepidisphaeraceae bacterium]